MTFELEMKVAWPNKTQHCAGKAADEAHQNGEMWNEASHENGECNHTDAPAQTPHFQFTVEFPDLWKD